MRSYVRKLATLASGSALGQIGAIAASPILSRIFSPADYGVSGVVLSISMMMVFVATLRYEEVIVSGRTATSRQNAFGLSLIILIVFSLGLLAVLVAANLVQRSLLSEALTSPLLLFAPLILFLSVAQQRVLPPFLIQFEQYGLVSLGNFVNGTLGALAQIGFGLLGLGALGLLVGRTIGLVLAIGCMILPILRSIVMPVLAANRRRHLRQVFRAYREQAYFLAPAGFMNTAAMQLPIFVIAPSFGTAAAGAYFFCQALANAALMVYRRSITALTAKEARELQRQGRPMFPFIAKVIAAVTVAVLPAAVVIFFTGERIVPLIFGHQWDQAGVAAKWLGFYYAAAAIHLPATALSTLLRFQRNMLATQTAHFVATAISLAIGMQIGDFETTVALVGIATAAVSGLHLVGMLRRIRRYDRSGGAAARGRGPGPDPDGPDHLGPD